MPYARSSIRCGSSPRAYGGIMARIATGCMINGRAYVIVYTVRGSAVRIISARRANPKEVVDYEHNAHQD